MSKNNSVALVSYPTSGQLPVCMTNDLLFHFLLQDTDHPNILKGIISSFFDISFDDIKSAFVENPITYGEDFSAKEMVLDVKALLNNANIINLEMQVLNHENWPERSISYLCRCFDNLESGEGYSNVKGAYHIGFLDYTLFPESPEFFAQYVIQNKKTNQLYSTKFGIDVVDLTKIDLATDEDRMHNRHLWASFFKATTWEEIHMLATQDKNIQSAAEKLGSLSADKKLRDEIWARQDWIRCQIDMRTYFETQIADKETAIAEAEATIAEKDAIIAALMAENMELRSRK